MNPENSPAYHVAIACGGTGGHLFPGMAVARALRQRGCSTTLIASQKEIDRAALKGEQESEVLFLPAAPLLKGNFAAFAAAWWKSFWLARASFAEKRPHAVLAMGGFTSAGPIFAGKLAGAVTCLHEANSVAGKANRFLAPWVDKVFIGFSAAAAHVRNRSVQFTGTPIRPQFRPIDRAAARTVLGFRPLDPVLLVMGGSQGATAINNALLQAAPALLAELPTLQFLHLTGESACASVRAGYEKLGARARVLPFLTEMEIALSAATAAVNRAGASSLAEIAAMQLPCLLVPYPTAADDHQYFNARALAQAGAARMVIQSQIKPEALAAELLVLLRDEPLRQEMIEALGKWHFPEAADDIAESILRGIEQTLERAPQTPAAPAFSHG